MELELRERIESYKEEKTDLRNDVESYCADLSVDLDTRWKLFVESDLGSVAPDIISFDDLGFTSAYEEMNRHQEVDLVNIVEDINIFVINYGSKPKEELSTYMQKYYDVYTPELVIQMKERLLDLFVKACVHDW
jgi:hypothetical protein